MTNDLDRNNDRDKSAVGTYKKSVGSKRNVIGNGQYVLFKLAT